MTVKIDGAWSLIWRVMWTSLLVLCLPGCIGASQRYGPNIAASLADAPMRRLETRHTIMYYREGRREQAVRVAERLEGCYRELHKAAEIRNPQAQGKMVVIQPDFAFNNAYVSPTNAGTELHTVIPTHNTFDFSTELGLPADPSYVGCHEIVHYVQLGQTEGLWRWVNLLFGNVITPQVGFDGWFIEGLATYYESRLQPRTGRMAWPAWRGMFHAGVAGRGVGGGDLSIFKRSSQWGNHYHVGSFFIEFLVERYGEDALWRLIGMQGRSWLFPFGVSLRFRSVYGRTLSTLIDEFSDWTDERFPPRKRPDNQRQLRSVGLNARYARAANGTEALIARANDQPTVLRIYRADGTLWRTHSLVDVMPPRQLQGIQPEIVSGMSFTADGNTLYFTTIDEGATFYRSRLMAYDVASGRLRLAHADIDGIGGSISPDGRRYYFSQPDGDRMHVAALELASGHIRRVLSALPQVYLLKPRLGPAGERLVVSEFSPKRGFEIALYSVNGAGTGDIVADSRALVASAAYDGSFIDGDHLLYVAEYQGRHQVYVHDISTLSSAATGAYGKGDGSLRTRLSDVPYLAFAPRAAGYSVRFLNREGWAWTLDEVALTAPQTASARVASVDAGAVETGGDDDIIAVTDIPEPVTAEVEIVSDTAYSQFDSLFRPSAHTVLFQAFDGDSLVGMGLSGGDRLGFHSWALAGYYGLSSQLVSGSVSYVNMKLAPLALSLNASQLSWEQNTLYVRDDMSELEQLEERRERNASISLGRSLYGSIGVALSGVITEDTRPDSLNEDLRERRLGGSVLSLSYAAGESTPYSGLRRGLASTIDVGLYPEALGTLDESIVDVRGSVSVTVPLPLSRRHTLGLSVRGRDLGGVAAGSNFLQLGGVSTFASLGRFPEDDVNINTDVVLPPNLRFVEYLRGFENYEIGVDRVAIADVGYRYPLIIDRGFASTLWVLPALFLRQIDVELFAAAALDASDNPGNMRFENFDDRLHMAAGGALSLNLSLWVLPVSFRYQIAQRLTDDEELVQEFGLGVTLF